MRTVTLLFACVVLAACGGAPSKTRVDRVASPISKYATGPIQSACLQADRKRATRALCGCVQAVANETLSRGDRTLAVKFYADPHHAQEIRQSDNSQHEVFWEKYKAFARTAERHCG